MKKLIIAAVIALGLMFASPAVAEDVYVSVTYSFEANHSDIPVSYNLYRDGVLVDTTTDQGAMEVLCYEVEMGQANFTLSATFEDRRESPQSDPFAFNVPKCEKVIVITVATNVK